MALTVESGAGLSTANAFISVADADTRLAARGLTNWDTITNSEKEQAIVRATDFMEQAYRTRWTGQRINSTQALSWPRYVCELVDGQPVLSNLVPTVVANACADLAFKAAAGDLNADLTRAVKREKVGPIETEYSDYSPQSVRYSSIDQALAPYLTRGGSMARLVRC